MKNIIFFDGICHLCNESIDFVIKQDHRRVFFVASLQGKAAELYLPKEDLKSLNTITLLFEGHLYQKSQAIKLILSQLGWREKFAATMIGLFPSHLADKIYDWVAKNRYRWFGQREVCRLPSETEKAYMLD